MKLANLLVRAIPPLGFIWLISHKGYKARQSPQPHNFLNLEGYSCPTSFYASLMDIMEGQDAVLDRALARESVSSHNDAISRCTVASPVIMQFPVYGT